MLCLLPQPQKKLQLDIETSNTLNHQKIKLYGSPTTKDMKKPHSSRWVSGAETLRREEQQNEQSHIHVWWIKIRRYTLGVSDPSPSPDHTAQGSSAKKINPHNFWL